VVQFRVQGLAAVLALWPLAFVMWKTAGEAVHSPSAAGLARRAS
jgi:hypothetical protein